MIVALLTLINLCESIHFWGLEQRPSWQARIYFIIETL